MKALGLSLMILGLIVSSSFAMHHDSPPVWPAGAWQTAVVATDDDVHKAEGGAEWLSDTSLVVKAAGDDIWNNADQFTYVYKEVSGDFDVAITVKSLEKTNDWAKAGLMIRQSLEPGAQNVLAAVRGNADLVTFQWRQDPDGSSSSERLTTTNGSIPVSIRLMRSGNSILGTYVNEYAGPDSWVPLDQLDNKSGNPTEPIEVISWADPVMVGIAVTSHAVGVITTAEIDLIGVEGGTAVEPDGKISLTWGSLKSE